ncbi:hypothetical protein [Streptomyces sp. ADI95-17]|uniref:hypothetical protein n=1 Tax=Streptomyces sp. ADI95-17 TaxID=1522759 RepID=UPI000FB5F2C7|nr:hypothetical protein [Streptomyces sp. ADI95-17]RPK70295.1 hypothetical protein EES42_16580 [Streptomyces sp. ADI95-17]
MSTTAARTGPTLPGPGSICCETASCHADGTTPGAGSATPYPPPVTKNRRQPGQHRHPAELPHHQTLLDCTDWASLATVRGTGESLPAALARLLDPDPVVRGTAARDALREVTHQNTIYEATVPVALYVAAVLGHPAVSAGDFGHDAGMPPNHPLLVRLLDWLGSTAHDADDECVAVGERHCGADFLQECREIRAFRDLRPALFSAVRPLLGHDDPDVRHAALVAAIPLSEHPDLVSHRGELVDHARRSQATSTDRHNRNRVLDALKAWGYDTDSLENAADIAAREQQARRMAERAYRAGSGTGGHCEDPPF